MPFWRENWQFGSRILWIYGIALAMCPDPAFSRDVEIREADSASDGGVQAGDSPFRPAGGAAWGLSHQQSCSTSVQAQLRSIVYFRLTLWGKKKIVAE
jgi:hypothetical protein